MIGDQKQLYNQVFFSLKIATFQEAEITPEVSGNANLYNPTLDTFGIGEIQTGEIGLSSMNTYGLSSSTFLELQ